MRITKKELVEQHQIVTIEEEYYIRVQVEKGKIIGLKVTVEDGSLQWISGKTSKDQKAWNKLSGKVREDIHKMLEAIEYE